VRSSEPCEIEALFGSSARGDADELSDVDYLLVDDSTTRLRTRKKWLESQGISVSEYTWLRLVRLFASRTLFAIHLKQESKPLHDRRGRYADLLASTIPADDYRDMYHDSLKLFDLLQEVPASRVGRAWALDHLAVSFRNSAILYLAGDGEYVFSFETLLEKMRARGRIDAKGVSALGRLRSLKRAYRSGVVGPVTRSTFDAALGAADRALRLGIGSRETHGVCMSSHHGGSSSTEAYAYLRTIERELISLSCSLDQDATMAKIELLRIIQNPHEYLWKAIYASDRIDILLNNVRKTY
jgi:nucleotidyltransferase-like protein